MASFRVQVETTICSIPANEWDSLDHGDSPFLLHGFLRALEDSASTGPESGWNPVYLVARDGGALVGACAAFIKTHSYGEYIFDWGWAEASERAGLEYYPKLVIAAPLTPATGRRLLIHPEANVDRVGAALVAGVRDLAERAKLSSVHWLFCTEHESELLAHAGFWPRASFQFHWENRPDYRSFEDFLGALTARKRKQIRKERRRSLDAMDEIRFVPGSNLTGTDLDAVDRYYRNTVNAHWSRDYLRPGFFHHAVETLGDTVVVATAVRGGDIVATALFLETAECLYGRYWGCDQHVEFLHFELAYYAGIERCIERGIPRFEAGAQGSHKLARGFMPKRTYSNHWIRHPGLGDAVRKYLEIESVDVAQTIEALAERGPFRNG